MFVVFARARVFSLRCFWKSNAADKHDLLLFIFRKYGCSQYPVVMILLGIKRVRRGKVPKDFSNEQVTRDAVRQMLQNELTPSTPSVV